MQLYPRFLLPEAYRLVDAFDGVPVGQSALDLRDARFSPTGGVRASESSLLQLGDAIRGIARTTCLQEGKLRTNQAFDRAAAKFLAEAAMPAGEMLHAEVWAWIAIRLVPDVVHQRFASGGRCMPERYCGPVARNAIGRLWLRGWVLGPELASSEKLTEDAAVAILERPSVASDHRLSRIILATWSVRRPAGVYAEELLREAMKRIRVEATIVDSLALEEPELERLVNDAFTATLADLQEPTN